MDEIYVVYEAAGIRGDVGWMHVLGINHDSDTLYHEVIRGPYEGVGVQRYTDTNASFQFKQKHPGIREKISGKPPNFALRGKDLREMTIDFYKDVERFQNHNLRLQSSIP